MRLLVRAILALSAAGIACPATAQSSDDEAKRVAAALARMGCSAGADGVGNRVTLPLTGTASDPFRGPQRTRCGTAALGELLHHGDVVVIDPATRNLRSMLTSRPRGASARGHWQCEVLPPSVRCSFAARAAGPP